MHTCMDQQLLSRTIVSIYRSSKWARDGEVEKEARILVGTEDLLVVALACIARMDVEWILKEGYDGREYNGRRQDLNP